MVLKVACFWTAGAPESNPSPSSRLWRQNLVGLRLPTQLLPAARCNYCDDDVKSLMQIALSDNKTNYMLIHCLDSMQFDTKILLEHILAMDVCSSLPFHKLTLVVTPSIKQGQVPPCLNLPMKGTCSMSHFAILIAGEDIITLTWGLNQSFIGRTDESCKEVKVKLCYAPINQVHRKWRKTVNDFSKDKTCQFIMVNKPYQKLDQSFKLRIEKEVPTVTLAYVYDSAGEEVAYWQNSDAKKSNNLFEVQGISGRHLSLDVASVCFSAFAL
ncbi:LOW QUALITY PROTEIN: hypothetical protein RJ640_005838, partial [Escallonia rubra]